MKKSKFDKYREDITSLQHKKMDEERTNAMFFAYHQLRAPIISMKWTVEMFLKGELGKLTPEQNGFLGDLYNNLDHLNDLVSHLLSTARIESGQLALRAERVDLVRVCGDVIKELKPLVIQKKHTIIFQEKTHVPEVAADSKYVTEAVKNLILNAIRYTKEKGIIELHLSQDKKHVVFSVKDNGIGIPRRQQPRIFEKFFRGDNAVKLSTEGTGLGLYIVKNLVESMGGKIWFDSKEGRGTEFYFALPIF
jgi:signal transduction histidine kinase